MALTDLSDIINRTTGGSSGAPESIFFYKDGRVGAAAAATAAGRLTSLWQYNGQPGAPTANPGAVSVPTNSTTGGLLQTNPGAGATKYLLGITASSLNAGTLILYDRLLHISGFSGTTITAQTVGGSLTRNTGGVGNQIWVEIYTQVGTTGTTITASYTNQAGASGHTTQATAFGNTNFREAQRIIPLPLASGDTGVQAVASVTVLASTLTAGDFGVTVARPLAYVPIGLLGTGSVRDFISGLPSIPVIDTNACLAMAWHANSATAPQIYGSVHFIEK